MTATRTERTLGVLAVAAEAAPLHLGTSTAVITTSTGSTLAPGTWNLTFTATHGTAANSTVVEKCLAHVTVTAV